MKFGFVSPEGSGLPFWLRVKDEGHQVMSYVPDKGEAFIHRNVGQGLVARASSVNELLAFAPDVYVFDCSGEGKLAESLRKRGALVIGGGDFCDALEMDRHFGETLAQTIGVHAPATHQFTSLSATIAFLKTTGAGKDWYFKTDEYLGASTTGHGESERLIRRLESFKKRFKDSVANILQETIDGYDISTACWWNGHDWIGPFEGTIENKKLMNDNVGPATGCSFNVVWWYEQYPRIAMELRFAALAEVFRARKAPAGVYDINAIISKKDRIPYFLEWTPRFGYDAEPTAMRAIKGELAQFYYDLATGRAAQVPFDTTRAQMSVRLSIPPYPWESVHKIPSADRAKATGAVGVPIGGIDPTDLSELYGGNLNQFMAYGLGLDPEGALVVTDPTGMVGIVCEDGIDVETMNNSIIDFIEGDLEIDDVQYRTDADKVLEKHLANIRSTGHSTGPL